MATLMRRVKRTGGKESMDEVDTPNGMDRWTDGGGRRKGREGKRRENGWMKKEGTTGSFLDVLSVTN